MYCKRWLASVVMLFAVGCEPNRTYLLLAGDAAGLGPEGAPDGAGPDAGFRPDVPALADAPSRPDIPAATDVPVARVDVVPANDVPMARDVPPAPTDVGRPPYVRGYLLKGSGPEVYFYRPRVGGGVGTKAVFPTRAVYSSHYATDEGIQIVPDAALAAIPNAPSPIRVRRGYWLVKTTWSSTTYAVVGCGELRALGSESQALALYGTYWNFGDRATMLGDRVRRTIDIDATFASYRIGAPIVGTTHPDGTLLRFQNRPDRPGVYLMMDGYARPITMSAFYENRFQEAAVVYTSNNYLLGPVVDGYLRDSEPDCAP